MKNSLEGPNSISEQAEERICGLEDKTIEIIQSWQHNFKKIKKNEQSLRNLWNTIKHANICIIGS